MKFGKHLETHLTSEWRKQHVDYEQLKKIVVKLAGVCPPESIPAARQAYLECKDPEFFAAADAELLKVSVSIDKTHQHSCGNLKPFQTFH